MIAFNSWSSSSVQVRGKQNIDPKKGLIVKSPQLEFILSFVQQEDVMCPMDNVSASVDGMPPRPAAN